MRIKIIHYANKSHCLLRLLLVPMSTGQLVINRPVQQFSRNTDHDIPRRLRQWRTLSSPRRVHKHLGSNMPYPTL